MVVGFNGGKGDALTFLFEVELALVTCGADAVLGHLMDLDEQLYAVLVTSPDLCHRVAYVILWTRGTCATVSGSVGRLGRPNMPSLMLAVAPLAAGKAIGAPRRGGSRSDSIYRKLIEVIVSGLL